MSKQAFEILRQNSEGWELENSVTYLNYHGPIFIKEKKENENC